MSWHLPPWVGCFPGKLGHPHIGGCRQWDTHGTLQPPPRLQPGSCRFLLRTSTPPTPSEVLCLGRIIRQKHRHQTVTKWGTLCT